MGKLILVTGGARSGKSTYAEQMASEMGSNVLYIATSIPFDDEMKQRIKKHREQRPSEWETLEAYMEMDRELADKLADRQAVLLDCITIMVTNLMMERCNDWDNLGPAVVSDMERYTVQEVQKLLETAQKANIPFILVTNEVGMGVVPEYASGRLFRDIAGRVNQIIAREADEVYLCVSGIPVKIKG
jgi:adenosylcobinamide kinase / adenosylcobinamide-phosphate guanylyltransferase